VGTGATNTAAIVASCGEANTAARMADNLVLGGYDDWFLPSSDELALMYSNLYLQGLGGVGWGYWSSSQVVADRAFFDYFAAGGYIQQRYKSDGMPVRVVRAF
jgi:hypothetical protein